MRPYLTIAVVVTLTVLALACWEYDFFCQNDNLLVFHAAYPEIARQLSKGQFPWISESGWAGGSFSGEYQFGIFSAFHLPLIWLLGQVPDLYVRAALYAVVYGTVCASGGYLLARRLHVPPGGAALVALGFSWNGFFARWGFRSWTPLLSSFAWVPWVWAELEAPTIRIAPLALAIYLVVSAGWPYTVAWLALLLSVYMLRRRHEAIKILVSSALGGAMASPALLGLLEHTREALRPVNHWEHRLEPASLLGLVLPLRELGLEQGLFPHQAANLNCGLVPVLVLLAALVGGQWRAWKRKPEILAITGLALVFALSPSFGPFRWSFRWCGLLLPGLSLMAALVLPDVLRSRSRWSPGFLGLLVVLLAGLTAPGSSPWLYAQLSLHGLVCVVLIWMWRAQARSTVALVGLTWMCATSAVYLEQPAGWRRWASPRGSAMGANLQTGVRTLSLYTWSDLTNADQVAFAEYRPGNFGMVEGLRCLNGATSIMAEPIYLMTGFGLAGESDLELSNTHLLPRLRPGATLERLGVNQLIISHSFAWSQSLEAWGWKLKHRGQYADVWSRVGLPVGEVLFLGQALTVNSLTGAAQLHAQQPDSDLVPVLAPHTGVQDLLKSSQGFQFSPAEITNRKSQRTSVSVTVKNPSQNAALLRLDRPFYPGYRVYLNGREGQLLVCDLAVMAVVVPAGFGGTVEFAFAPLSKRWGLPIAGLALLLLSGIVQWNRLRSRHADR